MPAQLPKSLTPFQEHCERWKHGCGAHECTRATRVVLCRGTLPCRVLFVGEAPGVNEDVIGVPFCGPAGKLLDRIIRQSVPEAVTYALTNLVGCVPKDQEGQKAGKPDDDQVRRCAPRLRELVAMADPELIVTVGQLPEEWLDPQNRDNVWYDREHRRQREVKHNPQADIPRVSIVHPAFVLRQPVAQQSLLVRRCVVTITKAVEKLP